jgi:hypothetical protein
MKGPILPRNDQLRIGQETEGSLGTPSSALSGMKRPAVPRKEQLRIDQETEQKFGHDFFGMMGHEGA